MTANIQQDIAPRSRRGRSQSSTRLRQRGKVSQSTLTVGFAVLSLASVMVLGFLYLQQVFGTAAHGSTIQALEQTMLQLKERHKELELDGAQLRSIQSVEDRVEKLNLVSATNVGYLAPAPRQVASRIAL